MIIIRQLKTLSLSAASLTRGHDGVLVEAPEDVDVEDAEAHLDARGEDLHQHGARGYDPAPATLGVVMLPECGGLGVETFQRCKKRMSRNLYHTMSNSEALDPCLMSSARCETINTEPVTTSRWEMGAVSAKTRDKSCDHP